MSYLDTLLTGQIFCVPLRHLAYVSDILNAPWMFLYRVRYIICCLDILLTAWSYLYKSIKIYNKSLIYMGFTI